MSEITPLPAATITLVRDTGSGYEVLLLQRNHQSGFMPGMFLFPGGALDAEDAAADLTALCCGVVEEEASRALGTAQAALAYWAAAIRECFEEAGVLLAYEPSGALVKLKDESVRARYAEYRSALNAGGLPFVEVLRREGLRLATDRLTYFSHWITPVGAPRRYDTRFFVAEAPTEQDALHDNRETIHHTWIAPGEALERFRGGEFKMRTPTVKTLEEFARHGSVRELIDALRAKGHVPAMLPRLTEKGERLLPGDPGYEAASAARGPWKL